MRSLPIVLSALCIVALTGDALAFQFAPFRVKFDPTGPGASQLFTVKNNTNQPATVQIRATTREVDENGKETMEESAMMKQNQFNKIGMADI